MLDTTRNRGLGVIFEEKKIALESSRNYAWCLVVENLQSHPEDLPKHQHLQQSTANTVLKSLILTAVYGFVCRFVKHVLRSFDSKTKSKHPIVMRLGGDFLHIGPETRLTSQKPEAKLLFSKGHVDRKVICETAN